MHYFDNVDFSDDRVLRTPVFHQKIEDYLKLLTTPHPDSVIRAIDFISFNARANEEIFRYTLATLYNKYNTSKIMGYDAIFVHISEKYYMSGLAPWADSAFVADITKRVKELSTSLIGDKAKDFVLADTNNVRIPMYAVKAKYLILFFYEPDCGHCKKATPKMKALYDELHQYDIEVLGINIKTDVEEWKEFIHKYNLNWINVADPYHQSNFRSYYDVRSTPTIFLLDKDKTIIAKRLGPEQLRELLGQILKIQLPDVEWDDDKQDKEEDDEHKK
ncbi:MAG: redoxin domain-containing protein [Bacteroidia bacterium]|nr:redoxin domain-containing protein [Bacteroidia bacterium]